MHSFKTPTHVSTWFPSSHFGFSLIYTCNMSAILHPYKFSVKVCNTFIVGKGSRIKVQDLEFWPKICYIDQGLISSKINSSCDYSVHTLLHCFFTSKKSILTECLTPTLGQTPYLTRKPHLKTSAPTPTLTPYL